MTIRLKVIILLLCSILLVASGISVAAWTTSVRFSDEQFASNAASQLDRVEELVSSFLRSGEQVAKALAGMPEGKQAKGTLTNYTATTENTQMDRTGFSPSEAMLFRRLDEARSLMPDVEIALFGVEDGGYIKSPDKVVSKGYDPRTRPWYKDIIQNNIDLSITDPYVSSSTKTLVTTVSARVKGDKGETIGVAGVDFILGALTSVLENVRVGRSGYLLLFDRRGKIMLDPKVPANLMKSAMEINDPGLAALSSKEPGRHSIQRDGVELLPSHAS